MKKKKVCKRCIVVIGISLLETVAIYFMYDFCRKSLDVAVPNIPEERYRHAVMYGVLDNGWGYVVHGSTDTICCGESGRSVSETVDVRARGGPFRIRYGETVNEDAGTIGAEGKPAETSPDEIISDQEKGAPAEWVQEK